jgi:hypothetical protein
MHLFHQLSISRRVMSDFNTLFQDFLNQRSEDINGACSTPKFLFEEGV